MKKLLIGLFAFAVVVSAFGISNAEARFLSGISKMHEASVSSGECISHWTFDYTENKLLYRFFPLNIYHYSPVVINYENMVEDCYWGEKAKKVCGRFKYGNWNWYYNLCMNRYLGNDETKSGFRGDIYPN